DVGAAGRLDGLDRAAPAGALHDSHERQAQLVRHLLALQMLALDRGVGRTATHREVVAADDDRPAVEPRPAEHEVGRDELLEVVGGVVVGASRDLADLVKAAGIDELVEALADRVAPARMLPRHALGPAELLSELLPPPQLVHLRFPVHGVRSYPQARGARWKTWKWRKPSSYRGAGVRA